MSGITVLGVVAVEPDGSLRLPSREQWKRILGPSGPGEYAVVPVHEIRDRSAVQPAKRLFHLGDLSGLDDVDHHQLAGAGLRTSDQVRAAGTSVLLRLLSADLVEKLVVAFGRLGVPIPEREGATPTQPGEVLRREILHEFLHHRDVWRVREDLARTGAFTTGSSFVQHGAGLDVVCGRCGAQHVGVQEKDAPGMVCGKCGNDLGVDLAVEVQALRVVLSQLPQESPDGGPRRA